MMEFIVSEFDENRDEYSIILDGRVVYSRVANKGDDFKVFSEGEKALGARDLECLFNLPLRFFPDSFVYEGEIVQEVDCLERSVLVEINGGEVSINYEINYALDRLTTGNFGHFLDEIDGLGLGENFYIEHRIFHKQLNISLGGEPSSVYNNIFDCLRCNLNSIKDIDSYICLNYVDKSIEDIFVSTFKFPKGYNVLCTQYLQWFGELLSNLSLDADVRTEIDGESTKLLVSCRKEPDLFENIERIFYQYIQLPYIDVCYSDHGCTREQRYFIKSIKQQVEDFKRKIRIKDDIISYYAGVNSKQLNKINDLESERAILLDSVESKGKVEKYKLFNGFVSVDRIQPLNKNKTISVDLSVIFGKPKSE
ncbi:hypothetical protein [Pseudoalteromonas sp. OOF1S-7]|uniref:hypothetical protein n=1 Tax=Pseudoalteromonas sp. OOF1S-7 TaxID=2917757 RepID=UPI001EF608AC|nr:hypothetical protein [Pseudoalteromonas sp. OOF1S-7]MCG7537389.1 hypothetical protein [Pseudoalteromonas sp. OOF1S-7]